MFEAAFVPRQKLEYETVDYKCPNCKKIERRMFRRGSDDGDKYLARKCTCGRIMYAVKEVVRRAA